MLWGRLACQNCMNQLWCTPESSDRITSSGSIFCSVPTTNSGRSGLVESPKCGRTKASHSRCQPCTCVRHGA